MPLLIKVARFAIRQAVIQKKTLPSDEISKKYFQLQVEIFREKGEKQLLPATPEGLAQKSIWTPSKLALAVLNPIKPKTIRKLLVQKISG